MQLIAYVIATGCLSFSDNALEIADHWFYPECERFWSLILSGIPRVPGIVHSASNDCEIRD